MSFIKNIIKRPAIAVMHKLNIYSLYSLWVTGPIKEDGWFRSYYEKSSVDAEGSPLPWITYPAIDFLKKRITKEMSVFEYGTGGSTLWWASMAKNVVGVEHNIQWYERVSNNLPANVELLYVELKYNGEYCKTASTRNKKFDIIVVDGRDRVNCITNSILALKSGGVIILDNSERNEYEEGIAHLLTNSFKRIEFIGMCPIVNYKSETSIFYRENNILGL